MIEAEKVNNLDVSLHHFFSRMESSHFFIQAGGGGSCHIVNFTNKNFILMSEEYSNYDTSLLPTPFRL